MAMTSVAAPPKRAQRHMWPTRRQRARIALTSLGFLVGFIVILPYIVMVFTALMSRSELFAPPVHVFPRDVTWSNFVEPWHQYSVATYFRNSIIIATGSAVLGVTVAIPAAYCLARVRFRARRGVLMALLMTQVLSPDILILGIYQEFRQFGLLDSLVPLIFMNAAFTLAVAVFILTDVFTAIAADIEEATWLDGASRVQSLVKVLLPLSGRGILVAALFIFVAAWHEFTVALTVLSSPELTPLSIGLFDFVGQYNAEWTYLFATALMGAVPVVICFIAMDRWLVTGLGDWGQR